MATNTANAPLCLFFFFFDFPFRVLEEPVPLPFPGNFVGDAVLKKALEFIPFSFFFFMT